MTWRKLLAAFHQMHERIYTIKDENDVVEFTTWKVRAIGNTGGAGRRGHVVARAARRAGARNPGARSISASPRHDRDPGLDGRSTAPASTIDGPALIEEPTTTFLLLPGQRATADGHGNYIVEIRA